jgi:hypothetical protein
MACTKSPPASSNQRRRARTDRQGIRRRHQGVHTGSCELSRNKELLTVKFEHAPPSSTLVTNNNGPVVDAALPGPSTAIFSSCGTRVRLNSLRPSNDKNGTVKTTIKQASDNRGHPRKLPDTQIRGRQMTGNNFWTISTTTQTTVTVTTWARSFASTSVRGRLASHAFSSSLTVSNASPLFPASSLLFGRSSMRFIRSPQTKETTPNSTKMTAQT